MVTDPEKGKSRTLVHDEFAESRIAAFEAAWQSGHAPSLADDFFAASHDDSKSLRWQLVAVDLEYRWNRAYSTQAGQDALGVCPTLVRYVVQVPEIGKLIDLPAWLVAEEYRVRRLWGDRPTHDRFLASYPGQVAELVGLLPLRTWFEITSRFHPDSGMAR